MSVIPAEDINSIDCFCAFASLDARVFFMGAIISVEVKNTHAKRKGS